MTTEEIGLLHKAANMLDEYAEIEAHSADHDVERRKRNALLYALEITNMATTLRSFGATAVPL